MYSSIWSVSLVSQTIHSVYISLQPRYCLLHLTLHRSFFITLSSWHIFLLQPFLHTESTAVDWAYSDGVSELREVADCTWSKVALFTGRWLYLASPLPSLPALPHLYTWCAFTLLKTTESLPHLRTQCIFLALSNLEGTNWDASPSSSGNLWPSHWNIIAPCPFLWEQSAFVYKALPMHRLSTCLFPRLEAPGVQRWHLLCSCKLQA